MLILEPAAGTNECMYMYRNMYLQYLGRRYAKGHVADTLCTQVGKVRYVCVKMIHVVLVLVLVLYMMYVLPTYSTYQLSIIETRTELNCWKGPQTD